MNEVFVDPAGAYVMVGPRTFYRDGVLFGTILEEQGTPPEERPMPTLWSSIVARYRKRPVEVEAIQLAPDNAEQIATWCGGVAVEEIDPEDETKRYVAVNIPTLEGVMRASEGDYVIKGTRGEFYPCKPEIFAGTYEVV